MGLPTGMRLGPYEILSPLGAGGMGEVYRAKDTRLERTVAIKVLNSQLAASPELRARFEREARIISQLQHPHICVLHDVGRENGTEFLVMEFLEGQSLAERLKKGSLPIEELLRMALQIADALEKAHRAGVVHRDLKPGNVMLTKTGAKLLDFGLAKPLAAGATARVGSAASASVFSAALTQTSPVPSPVSPLSSAGTVVGTMQYMSPEQIQGQEADARSDLFAFGVMLFEMATGKRAFEGKSQASIVGQILAVDPPPVGTLRPETPPALERLISICLAKDPDERFQCAHDVELQLKWIAEGREPAAAAAVESKRRWLPWALASAAILALMVLGILYAEVGRPSQAAVVRSSILPPENSQFTLMAVDAGPIVLSPDGRHMAFSAPDQQGKLVLWVRALDSLAAQPLAGTDGATFPFWSPDSRYLGFFADGKLKKSDASGGPPQTLCDAPSGRGGTWGIHGDIVFAPSTTSPLQHVSAEGGVPVDLMDWPSQFLTQRWPYFLPDGNHFLFFDRDVANSSDTGIYIAQVGSKQRRFLLPSDSNAIYAAPGYLLYLRGDGLFAQPFDAGRAQVTGDAKPIAEHVGENFIVAYGGFSASQTGILVFQRGFGAAGGDSLVWLDRMGKQLGTVAQGEQYSWPRISPDGRQLAVQVGSVTGAGVMGGATDIWIFDLLRGTRSRLTFGPGISFSPLWSPDAKTIYYSALRKGLPHIYSKAANGTGNEAALYDGGTDERVRSISRDGRYLLFERFDPVAKTKQDIWALPLFGDRKPFPLVQTPFSDVQPAFSPESKWVAYASNESGRMEVYITSFPAPLSKLQVSTAGGQSPRWAPDGRTLFFLSEDRHIMAVDVRPRGDSLALGVPHPLAAMTVNMASSGLSSFGPIEVAPDNKRLMVTMARITSNPEPATLVINWPAELKK